MSAQLRIKNWLRQQTHNDSRPPDILTQTQTSPENKQSMVSYIPGEFVIQCGDKKSGVITDLHTLKKKDHIYFKEYENMQTLHSKGKIIRLN